MVEYGLKKSNVVCINGEIGRRRWMMRYCCIGKVKEYNYLAITVEGGNRGGFNRMGDRMKESNGLVGMVEYTAELSGSKYVIGKDG